MLNSLLALAAFGSEEWIRNVLFSLGVMWKGVLAIFIVITLIIAAVAVLNLAAKRKKKKDGEENDR